MSQTSSRPPQQSSRASHSELEYTPYTPYSPAVSDSFPQSPRTLPDVIPEKSFEEEQGSSSRHGGKGNPIMSVYRSLSWMVGFREKWSLLLFLVCGGALLGFCLGRSMLLNPALNIGKAVPVPGEFFFFARPLFKINYYIHVYLSIIGGILVGLQFLPSIRINSVILHRINGYAVLICLIPGNICGSIVALKSLGGEINIQLVYYLLGIMITFTGLIGIWNVKKNTNMHRKMMLRMVTYFCVIVTARVIMFITRAVVAKIGTFYSVWRCDQMIYLASDLQAAKTLYPTCFGDNVDPSKVFVAVLANQGPDDLNASSGIRATMGLAMWVSFVLHVVGVEYYLIKTEPKNTTRYGYILEPYDSTNEKTPWEYKRR